MSNTYLYYDAALVPRKFGLQNKGASCYWNAVIQSVLSLPSFNAMILTSESKGNKLIDMLKITIKAGISKNSAKRQQHDAILNQSASIMWDCMFQTESKRKDLVQLTSGQQCANEGFYLLLNSIDLPACQELFMHKYESVVTCSKCKHKHVRDDSYASFEIEPGLCTEVLGTDGKVVKHQIDSLEEFITGQESAVMEFNCNKCEPKNKTKSKDVLPKTKTSRIVMVPEILVCVSKKYIVRQNRTKKLNVVTDFPEQLSFPGFDGPLKYEAVSQIEHSGSASGGHYWACSKRGDSWYNLNDASVSPGKFKPTASTYMVFYHMIK
jgi:ubiquitin C-terminal hydrolase